MSWPRVFRWRPGAATPKAAADPADDSVSAALGVAASGPLAAVIEERQRIYQALHDDLGAKLLDLVYSASTAEQADRAREALQILRDVVSQSSRPAAPLRATLDAIRSEAQQRLDALRAALDWQQDAIEQDPELDQAQVLHLSRLVREAISNALRHGMTAALRIRVQTLGSELAVEITDFGRFRSEGIGQGTGTRNMQQHAEQLGGELEWNEATLGGTRVLLRFPLPARTATA